MRISFSGQRAAQRGISLVEVLVSMAITVLILGGVMQALLSNQRNATWSDDIAFIQENARYAAEMLARDIRWAGDWGCVVNNDSTVTFANSLDVSGDHDWLTLEGIYGFDGSNEASFPVELAGLWSANDAYVGSSVDKPDAVIFRGADDGVNLTVVSHQPAAANFKVSRQHTMTPGDLALVVSEDCSDVGLMQMTGPSSGNNVTFVHNTGGSQSPGNCTKVIRWKNGSFDCDDPPGPSDRGDPYGPGSRIMGFAGVGYHVGESAADTTQPALYRVLYGEFDGVNNIASRSDEIAMGVEDLQILYGVDTDNDTLADAYIRATGIGGVGNPVDWAQVVSVRFTLLLRSYGETREETDAVDHIGYPYAGNDSSYTGHAYQDGYLRQSVSRTVRLRNVGASS